MPPDTLVVPPPGDRNYNIAALEYLEFMGITPVIPSIRSRDEEVLQDDPFLYYMIRRLGLVPILRVPGKALSRGSWVHKYLEFAALPEESRDLSYTQTIGHREAELRELCKQVGWESENLYNTLADERHHAEAVRGWLKALAQYRGPAVPQGLFGYLNAPNKRVLARELVVKYTDPSYPRAPLCATFDALNFYPLSKTLWIDDYKSSEVSPLTRAETVRHSFQTLHYRYLLTQLINCGWVHQQWPDLPPDVRVGGMRHILIQKPSIELCGQDRPYHYTAVGKRPVNEGRCGSARATPNSAGGWTVSRYARMDKEGYPWDPHTLVKTDEYPSEEEVTDVMSLWCGKKAEKEYTGEPSADLYSKRCLHWYLGTGDYSGIDRQSDPPINISEMAGPLDDTEMQFYKQRLQLLYDAATRKPVPVLFPPTGRGMVNMGGKLNRYAIFFNNPIGVWPQLIQEHHFTQSHLDIDEAA